MTWPATSASRSRKQSCRANRCMSPTRCSCRDGGEVTPIRSVDKIVIGGGRRGPITEALQRAFFDVINGKVPDVHGWLTYVYPEEGSLRSADKKETDVGARY
jgi:Branched-chain amino acid aminotransferase/4-amino-4-deoxychorismate lyase